MSARVVVLSLACLAVTGCFKAWDLGGPWACSDGGVCAEGYTCDDAVCCKPGGTPACPTLPAPDGTCGPGDTKKTFYRDSDRDGAGDPRVSRQFCRAPVREAWSENANDCNDAEVAVGPLASERCNAKDDDCDGQIDEGLVLRTWYRDDDRDGFGTDCADCKLLACAQPDGYASRGGDCADDAGTIFPGALERCNGTDDNCNGQPDDPPYSDVENPGMPDPAFDCATGQLGTCGLGSRQCVFSGTRFTPVCVPRAPASTDLCGDGLDNDCSGAADDRPGCGGPSSLLNTAGVSIGALTFPDAGVSVAGLPRGCQRLAPGSERMAWLNPSWIGNGGALHVWFAEAPAGTWWDLTPSTQLRLPFVFSMVGSSAGGWDTPGRFINPIIQLCGETESSFRRYTPNATLFSVGTATKVISVPLAGGAGWAIDGSASFDVKKVRRVEILAAPEDTASVTFTNRFVTDAGTVGFQ